MEKRDFLNNEKAKAIEHSRPTWWSQSTPCNRAVVPTDNDIREINDPVIVANYEGESRGTEKQTRARGDEASFSQHPARISSCVSFLNAISPVLIWTVMNFSFRIFRSQERIRSVI